MADEAKISDYLKDKIYTISHSGISHEELVDGYKNWCGKYDEDLAAGDYNSPYNAATTLGQYYNTERRKEVRILDVGAGTGLVAEELRKLGFEKMDALDPLACMLDVARRKGVYDHYIEETLSPTQPSSIPQDTYDCVTASSTFGYYHIPFECIKELTRVVKPGGLIVISGRKLEDTDYHQGLSKFAEGLVKDGVIVELDRPIHDVYMTGARGLTYVFKVL